MDMTGSGIMHAIAGLQVQRAELIDTNPSAALGLAAIQPPNPPVFGPKLRILGLLPSLGVPPVDPFSAQNLPWKSACKRDPRREVRIGVENGPTAVISVG
jgi:hypothetical protein